MSTTAPKPVTTPMPVQLSAPEFEVCILPHLSMPKRGLKCKLGCWASCTRTRRDMPRVRLPSASLSPILEFQARTAENLRSASNTHGGHTTQGEDAMARVSLDLENQDDLQVLQA